MFLFFNMLSRFVKVFLSRSKCLLMSWLQSPTTVIVEPKKIELASVFRFSTSICYEVITHLEPGILECEVRWDQGSIATNKGSGDDGIPVELFQILIMALWKCRTQYASKFGKLSSCHRTGKGQFSFQSQGKAMPKNVQTTAQLHSSHTLTK